MENKLPALRCIAVLILFLMISGCSNSNSDSDENTGPGSSRAVVPVRVDSIKTATLDVIVGGYGITSAQQIYQVISPVTGIIKNFAFYNGDKVTKGEIIASIIPKESYSAVKGAETLMSNAVTDEQKKEAERALKIAEHNANQIKITAPFSGNIINRIKNENEIVNEGELIAGLINRNSILFIAQIPADSIYLVKTGQPVTLSFPSVHGRHFNGTVRRIEPRLNVQSQTIPVQINIENPGLMLADSLYGEASIIVGAHRNVFVVPLKALIHDEENNTYSIKIINSDSIAFPVKVTTGLKRDSLEEIHSEKIKEGMKVIVEGNYGLPDSTKVSIKK